MAKQKRYGVLLNVTPNGGMMMATVIIRDTVTGVLYLQLVNGYGGGLTPLLDADGKPIVWNDGDELNGML